MSPPGLVLRATEVTDAPGLCALANLPGVRWGTMRQPYQTLEATRRRLEQRGPGVRIVALLEGSIVGDAGWQRFGGRREHTAELGMSVHDDHVGRGIGTALLEALIDSADNWHDVRRLQLQVFHDNHRAIRLYERFGFEREGVMRAAAIRAGRFEDIVPMARLRPPR